MLLKKVKSLFKKADKDEESQILKEKCLAADSAGNMKNDFTDNFSTGSSDQLVESERAEKVVVNGEDSLVRAETFSDEKEGLMFSKGGQKVTNVEEDVVVERST